MKMSVSRPAADRLSRSFVPATGWWADGTVEVVVDVGGLVLVVVVQLPFGVLLHTSTGVMSVHVPTVVLMQASFVHESPSSQAGESGSQRRAP